MRVSEAGVYCTNFIPHFYLSIEGVSFVMVEVYWFQDPHLARLNSNLALTRAFLKLMRVCRWLGL